MTQRYLGGIITANPTEPSENFSDSAASGMWTMQEALAFSKAGDWPDPASINPSKFIESVFSTYVYDGTGSSQTIANGIDLVNKEGLVWTKIRESNGGAEDHFLVDTVSPSPSNTNYFVKSLTSNSTAGFQEPYNSITAWNTTGYTINSHLSFGGNGYAYVSWTFREQPKFFDIVTYTGTGSALTVDHNLGSVPGMMMFKRTDSAGNWRVFHRSVGATKALRLNGSDVAATSSSYFNDTAPTSTQFTVGTDLSDSGGTFVAYLFAHNDGDGGFGSTGDQDMIKCGSYTGNNSTNAITLGFEPQWILIKNATKASTDWILFDTMRGIVTGGSDDYVFPSGDAGEGAAELIEVSATGFNLVNSNEHTNEASHTYVYVAIRRGQMKAPTAGTDVLAMYDLDDLSLNTVVSSTAEGGTPFPADLALHRHNLGGNQFITRLTGGIGTEIAGGASSYRGWLNPHDNSAEDTGTYGIYYKMYNNRFSINNNGADGGQSFIFSYQFRRQPKVFDVVAYTGNGTAGKTINHNLGATPQLIIVKSRTDSDNWIVYTETSGNTKYQTLDTNSAAGTWSGAWNNTTPTSSVFTVGNGDAVNENTDNFVAYLFATLSGVSKVGTYSGTGTSVDVDCGFTNGARFVLAKRTDSTGDWYIWDSVNGIVSGNDPYIILNTTAAPTTNTDYIDPLSSGFTITSNAGSDLNHNGGSYVFLAIA